jgi:hypothetical protein
MRRLAEAVEILVWVSLAVRDVMDAGRLSRFPARIDTAHTHNVSIPALFLWLT